MKTNQELFNKHFEEYKQWVLNNKKFPTTHDDGRFKDGVILSTWRHNYKEKIIEFENSVKDSMRNIIIGSKQLSADRKIFNKTLTRECYPWEPKNLQEYLEGDNRYHFYSINTYITLMKYINESSDDIGWLLFYRSLFPDIEINNTYIGNKKKFEMFKKISMNILNTLTDREREIICLAYGLTDGTQRTLTSIADIFKISSGRIGQILNKAIRKLKHPSRFHRFKEIDYIVDDDLDISHGIGHWFILCYDGKKTAVKRNTSELEEVLEQEGFDYSVPFGSCKIVSVKSYTHYGYQIDPEIRLIIDELLTSSSNYKIFNYTEVSITKQKPIKTVKEYVDEYHCDMIARMEEQELLSERQTKAKKLKEEAEGIIKTYQTYCQTSMLRAPSIFQAWGPHPIRDIEDQTTTLFKNEFPSKLAKIVNSLIIDEDHIWVDKFNESVRKYFIPTDCCTFAASTLKKCLDAKLHDYTIEVIFSAPSDIDHYLHIKFISDISENIIKVEKG